MLTATKFTPEDYNLSIVDKVSKIKDYTIIYTKFKVRSERLTLYIQEDQKRYQISDLGFILDNVRVDVKSLLIYDKDFYYSMLKILNTYGCFLNNDNIITYFKTTDDKDFVQSIFSYIQCSIHLDVFIDDYFNCKRK